MEQNLEYNKEIYRLALRTNRHITFQSVMGAVKLLLILVPIILGIIYLPPLLKNVFEQYQDLLGPISGQNNSVQDFLKSGESLNNIKAGILRGDFKDLIK